jgi:hypothetical protein
METELGPIYPVLRRSIAALVRDYSIANFDYFQVMK